MAKEPKTQKTKASVAHFIAAIENETRRKDAKALDKMLREITGQKPALWGPSIIGYGEYDGPTGRWMRSAFAPRKASLVVYMMAGAGANEALLKKLGKHKAKGGCLYINKLTDVDEAALRALIKRSWDLMEKKYPE